MNRVMCTLIIFGTFTSLEKSIKSFYLTMPKTDFNPIANVFEFERD